MCYDYPDIYGAQRFSAKKSPGYEGRIFKMAGAGKNLLLAAKFRPAPLVAILKSNPVDAWAGVGLFLVRVRLGIGLG